MVLPLASWGAGTRRLAALAIADALQDENPITIVDEIEKGLEPYRQRTLIKNLTETGAQVFITTHSGAALSATAEASLWYLDGNTTIGSLPNKKVCHHQRSDPDTFLARLAVVCEGATEVGFTSLLLAKALGSPLEHGVWITNGNGHESVLELLEGLAAGGLSFAGFVDNEGKWPERWARLKQRLGALLFQWPQGCIEQNVIPLFNDDVLPSLIEDPEDSYSGMRLRSLADRLEIPHADLDVIKAMAGDKFTQLIVEAALGTVPAKFANADKRTVRGFQGHAKVWFKSIEGGRELADKAFELGALPKLEPLVLPFISAVRQAIGLPGIEGLRE